MFLRFIINKLSKFIEFVGFIGLLAFLAFLAFLIFHFALSFTYLPSPLAYCFSPFHFSLPLIPLRLTTCGLYAMSFALSTIPYELWAFLLPSPPSSFVSRLSSLTPVFFHSAFRIMRPHTSQPSSIIPLFQYSIFFPMTLSFTTPRQFLPALSQRPPNLDFNLLPWQEGFGMIAFYKKKRSQFPWKKRWGIWKMQRKSWKPLR